VIELGGAFNRALYAQPVGRWLRGRLDAGRVFEAVELELARGGAGLDGLRVAFLSDLHLGCFLMEEDLARVCARVADARPDLVCLGGDLVHARPDDVERIGPALDALCPRLGIFAVPGNHDRYADPQLRRWRPFLEECGVTVLVNEGRRIDVDGDPLWLAGVDDLGLGEPDLEAALDGAREREPVLLLSHHPDLFWEAASVGVDLTLSGHTHAGQITFFGRAFTRHTQLGFWRGRFEIDGAQLYVGRGAGTSGLPLRVNAPAEVPLITLRTPAEADARYPHGSCGGRLSP
jgi:predicted MPP superfamily phosphohydrolase